MNTTKIKDDLHQMIDQIEDQATLEAIRTLLAPQIGAIYSLPGQLLNQEEIEDLLSDSLSANWASSFYQPYFDSRQNPNKLDL